MKLTDKLRLAGRGICVLALGLLGATMSVAQGGYQIGENSASAYAGPVRLARVSYLSGPVSWRPDDSAAWSKASMNLPFRQGAELWVKPGSRAEIQFDDGSTLRLGGGATVCLQNLYSDDRGEFSELKLTGGLATLHAKGKHAEFQIDTPLSSVKAAGPVLVRVGVGNTVEVACESGDARVAGRQGETVLHSRERLSVADPNAPYRVTPIPEPDQWDHFNGNRDRIYSHHNLHTPSSIDLVAGDLDDYGSWHDDPRYGYVWAPTVYESGWRPYHHGHWVWVSPWGWTWVADEPWGWAPYHYGTWVVEPYGWAWVPGPAVQYWSPAVVDFVVEDDFVAWVPLAPAEVLYPPLIDIGFRSGNWWFDFSIGQAAVFFPTGPSLCFARPWDNVFVNRQVNVTNVTNITNIFNNSTVASSNVFVRNSPFVPVNATRFAGMTTATRTAFMNSGTFAKAPADPRGTAFRTGRSFARAPSSGPQVSGPLTMRPGRSSFTPTRMFARAAGPEQAALQRSVVRSGLPTAISRKGAPIARAFSAVNRPAAVMRQPVAGSAMTHNQSGRFSAQSKGQFAMRRSSLGAAGGANGEPHSMAMRSHGAGHVPPSVNPSAGRGASGQTRTGSGRHGSGQVVQHPAYREPERPANRDRQPRSFARSTPNLSPRGRGTGPADLRSMGRSEAMPRMRSMPNPQWRYGEGSAVRRSESNRSTFQPSGPQRGGGASRSGGSGGAGSGDKHRRGG